MLRQGSEDGVPFNLIQLLRIDHSPEARFLFGCLA